MTENNNRSDSSIVDTKWAQDLIQVPSAFVKQSSTVLQVIDLFISQRLDCVLVIDDKVLTSHMKLVGRISIKDILKTLLPCLLKNDAGYLDATLNNPVQNLILTHPRTVNPWAPFTDILAIMLTDFTQVVGIEYDNKLIGQVTYKDLLGAIGRLNTPCFAQLKLHSRPDNKVDDINSTHVVCLSESDDISRAICLFVSTAIQHIPVLDERAKFIGLFCQHDILEYIRQSTDPIKTSLFPDKFSVAGQSVTSLLQPEMPTISRNTEIIYAVAQMLRSKVSCLAITDSNKTFHGLISCADIFKWAIDCLTLNS